MRRGDIFQLCPDPAAGIDQQGTNLVLIVSPDKFNACTKVPIVLPITSGNVVRTAGFAVSLDGCGTVTRGVIRCDQPRALDVRALQGKRLESVPQDVMEDALARLATILG